MGKNIGFSGDEALKALESRLKAGKVKGPEAIAFLAKIVPLLRKRSKKLSGVMRFATEVAENDRLHVTAYGVWKRKAMLGGVPLWVRANGPEIKAPEQVVDTEAVVAAVVGHPRPSSMI